MPRLLGHAICLTFKATNRGHVHRPVTLHKGQVLSVIRLPPHFGLRSNASLDFDHFLRSYGQFVGCAVPGCQPPPAQVQDADLQLVGSGEQQNGKAM